MTGGPLEPIDIKDVRIRLERAVARKLQLASAQRQAGLAKQYRSDAMDIEFILALHDHMWTALHQAAASLPPDQKEFAQAARWGVMQPIARGNRHEFKLVSTKEQTL